MLPLCNAQQEIEVDKTPYEIFTLIDSRDLTQKMFDSNAFNLIAVVEQTDPLVYSFKNDLDFLGRKNTFNSSTKLFATVLPHTGGSKLLLTVKTNPAFYLISVLMVLGLIINLSNSGPMASNIIFLVILLSIIPMDIHSKKDLLKRTTSLITQ